MSRQKISDLFLYRHRFALGYIFLTLFFTLLLFTLPLISRSSLTEAEISSAEVSMNLNFSDLSTLNFVDLPYHLLQKLSIRIFGLSAYAVKLPSIFVGLFLGLLLILLLNRWFKNNVSLLASVLIVFSTPFLSLAGLGTPLIMLVFWPTLLLWLGSKIQGVKRPHVSYVFWFSVALLLALFTPFMVYFVIFCVFFVIFQPHLRFVLRSLPKPVLILLILFSLTGLALVIYLLVTNPGSILALLVGANFVPSDYFANIKTAIEMAFSWHGYSGGTFIAPLVSLPMLTISVIGLCSTAKGFFASRNSIATLLLIFTLIISGFNSDAIVFILIPLAILVAHGIKYLLEKWYALFPENPYARVSAFIPLFTLFALMIIPSVEHYFYSYYYNPKVVYESSRTLSTLRTRVLTREFLETIPENAEIDLVPSENVAFYENLTQAPLLSLASLPLENHGLIVTETPAEDADLVIFLGDPNPPENFELTRLFVSTDRVDSDIIYVYQRD